MATKTAGVDLWAPIVPHMLYARSLVGQFIVDVAHDALMLYNKCVH